MTTNPKLEFIQLAKELTCSDDIEVILAAACKLEGYLGEDAEDDAEYSLPETPIPFMEQCNIWTVAHGLVPLRLYDFQKGWVDWLHDDPVSSTPQPEILISARQMGTSTIMPLYGTYLAVQKPWTKVMVVSPRHYAAIETRDRVQAAIEGMGLPVDKIAKTKITFQNGSEITFGGPNDLGRGTSPEAFNVLIMLDAAFYPYSMDHDLMSYTMRALHGGTRVIVASSPRFGKGFLFDLIDKHQFPYMTTTYRAHVDRDPKWAEDMKKSISPSNWMSEMECQFIMVDDEPEK